MSQKQQGNSSSPLLAVLSQYRKLRTNAASVDSPDVEEDKAKRHARDDQDETFDEDLEYVKRGGQGQGDPKDFLHLYDDTEDTESTSLPMASTPKRRMEHESDNDDSPDYEPRPNSSSSESDVNDTSQEGTYQKLSIRTRKRNTSLRHVGPDGKIKPGNLFTVPNTKAKVLVEQTQDTQDNPAQGKTIQPQDNSSISVPDTVVLETQSLEE